MPRVTKNLFSVAIGSRPMCIRMKRDVLHTTEVSKFKALQYLVLDFYNKTDTSGTSTITINDVSKEDVILLANNLKALAESFE